MRASRSQLDQNSERRDRGRFVHRRHEPAGALAAVAGGGCTESQGRDFPADSPVVLHTVVVVAAVLPAWILHHGAFCPAVDLFSRVLDYEIWGPGTTRKGLLGPAVGSHPCGPRDEVGGHT